MQTPTKPNAPSQASEAGDAGRLADVLQEIAADAIEFWERQRITYNVILLLVVSVVFVVHAPGFLQRASVDFFLALFLLAVLANVAYCAAYPVDVFVQRSGLRAACRRVRRALLLVGTLFAGVLAQFIARGMVGGA